MSAWELQWVHGHSKLKKQACVLEFGNDTERSHALLNYSCELKMTVWQLVVSSPSQNSLLQWTCVLYRSYSSLWYVFFFFFSNFSCFLIYRAVFLLLKLSLSPDKLFTSLYWLVRNPAHWLGQLFQTCGETENMKF